ncbi:MAG: PAS domain S-box protein [Candidatus Riflebacteria bacterium]|nr:PAS domain S-box protein [Candidatus Riflebacteria bacterium]
MNPTHFKGGLLERLRKKRQERYRKIFSLVLDFSYSFVIGSDGTTEREWTAGGMEELTGFSLQEIDSIGWDSILLEEYETKIEEHRRKLLAGHSSTVEFRIITKEGKLKWLRDKAVSELSGKRKKSVKIVGAVKDITEEILARERIAYLSAIIESSESAIISETKDGKIVSWNEGARKMLGLGLEETEGRDFTSFFINDSVQLFNDRFSKALVGEKADAFLASIKHFSGTELTLLISLSPVKTSEGNVVGVAIVCRDFTEVKKAESDLLSAHSEINQIFNGISLGICLINQKNDIVKGNRAFSEMFGVNKKNYQGKSCCEILAFRECSKNGCPVEKIFSGQEKQLVELSKEIGGIRKDFLFSCSPFKDTTGKVTLTIGCFTDITALREAEKELKESREQLLQSEKLAAIGELASGIAHEINQPLNHIFITAQIAEKLLEKAESPNSELIKQIKVIYENVERAGVVIETLRNFSRKETEKIGTLNARIAVNTALDMLGMQLRDSGIHIKLLNLSESLECYATKNKLTQVILNLLLNARNSFEGLEKISVKTIEIIFDKTPEEVLITIKDNGSGIPSEVLPKIFLPFFTTKPPGKGTGLGLPISQQIINDFGGRILIKSEYGKGTDVLLFLKRKIV